MTSPETETPLATMLRSMDPESRAAMTNEVTAWLGRLVLLYGVPFDYLVPEEAMLPAEAIRFFFLDPIWIQSLVQGACSVGNNGYGDSIIDRVMNEWVQPNQPQQQTPSSLVNKKAAGVRDRLRHQYEGVDLPAQGEDLHWPLTGFLLRSAVVDGWRGLEVMAYKDLSDAETASLVTKMRDAGELNTIFTHAKDIAQRSTLKYQLRDMLREQTEEQKAQLYQTVDVDNDEQVIKLLIDRVAPLKALRIEQLSQDIMLGLFNGMIGQLVIRQPQEGLHFGLARDNADFIKSLRELGYKSRARAGEVLEGSSVKLSDAGLMRDMNKGVINIKNLAQQMQEKLSSLEQLQKDQQGDIKFTSAEFAVEMIESAGEFTFIPERKPKQ
jgi:hypothetical protein